MRTASILLALVVVLGFVREAGASFVNVTCERYVQIGSYDYGFIDCREITSGRAWTTMYAGPLGAFEVPFVARTVGVDGAAQATHIDEFHSKRRTCGVR